MWQLENVEQLAESREKTFYINICTYKLAEGHVHCTQGQNLSGSLHQGGKLRSEMQTAEETSSVLAHTESAGEASGGPVLLAGWYVTEKAT